MRITRRAFLRYWLPVIVMVAVIAVESTAALSSGHTVQFLHWVLAKLRVQVHDLDELNHVLRKVGHCVGYGFLGFVIFRAFRGTYRFRTQGYDGWISSRVLPTSYTDIFSTLWRLEWAAWALGGTFLVAAADEVHQMRLPSRTGSWWDVLLDTSAAFVTQVLIYGMDRAKAARLSRRRA